MSIPNEHRLRKHSEFELVYQCGLRHFSQVLTAFYLVRVESGATDQELDNVGSVRPMGRVARVGITVGRALGKATVRNRIKRRVRAAVGKNLGRLTRPLDIVINPKKAVAEIDFVQLCSEVARAFEVIEQKAVPRPRQRTQNLRREQRPANGDRAAASAARKN
jgi:ribonuclease P protein component